MNVEYRLPGRDHLGRVFLTWTPVEARVRVANPTGTAAVPVTLGNGGAAGGGRVTFSAKRLGTRSSSLALDLPVSGAWVSFFVAGEFGRPSVSLGDAVIEALGSGSLGLLGTRRVTVRIRKDAQTLSAAERDRFLAAFGTLNGGGAGRFRDFRDMHVNASVLEAHGNVGFLPWHRAYLLDLERELQAIDARVTLPYWRFDRPAPNVFTREFMGVPNVAGQLEFTPGHPFTTWRTDGALGITRTPLFNTANAPPGLLHGTTDDQPGRSGGNGVLRKLRRPGGQSARLCTRELHRLHQVVTNRRAGSALLHAPLQRRSPLGQVAMDSQAHESGQLTRFRSSRLRTASGIASRHDVAVERRYRSAEAVDRARRDPCTVAIDNGARPDAHRRSNDRLPGRRGWRPARVRVRRRAVRMRR